MAVIEADAQERQQRKQKATAEATALKDEGNKYFKQGDYHKAIDLYTQVGIYYSMSTFYWYHQGPERCLYSFSLFICLSLCLSIHPSISLKPFWYTLFIKMVCIGRRSLRQSGAVLFNSLPSNIQDLQFLNILCMSHVFISLTLHSCI